MSHKLSKVAQKFLAKQMLKKATDGEGQDLYQFLNNLFIVLSMSSANTTDEKIHGAINLLGYFLHGDFSAFEKMKNLRNQSMTSFMESERARILEEEGGETFCNCENSHCPHGEEPCPNVVTGDKEVMYVGAVCDECYEKMPEEYRR